jgi:hypothetical protein
VGATEVPSAALFVSVWRVPSVASPRLTSGREFDERLEFAFATAGREPVANVSLLRQSGQLKDPDARRDSGEVRRNGERMGPAGAVIVG